MEPSFNGAPYRQYADPDRQQPGTCFRLAAAGRVWRPKGGGLRNLTLPAAQRRCQQHPGSSRSPAALRPRPMSRPAKGERPVPPSTNSPSRPDRSQRRSSRLRTGPLWKRPFVEVATSPVRPSTRCCCRVVGAESIPSSPIWASLVAPSTGCWRRRTPTAPNCWRTRPLSLVAAHLGGRRTHNIVAELADLNSASGLWHWLRRQLILSSSPLCGA